jgi:hypothetical protein
MKKIEVQMLLCTLTKKFMKVQGNMLNVLGIILFYKVVGWFDGQDIGVEPKRLRFNPLYQHIVTNITITHRLHHQLQQHNRLNHCLHHH